MMTTNAIIISCRLINLEKSMTTFTLTKNFPLENIQALKISLHSLYLILFYTSQEEEDKPFKPKGIYKWKKLIYQFTQNSVTLTSRFHLQSFSVNNPQAHWSFAFNSQNYDKLMNLSEIDYLFHFIFHHTTSTTQQLTSGDVFSDKKNRYCSRKRRWDVFENKLKSI